MANLSGLARPRAPRYRLVMFEILTHRTFRHLFAAQIVALLGTGLTTVALGLLAFDLAGDQAAMVLGTAFTIKMLAYVGIGPIAGGFADLLPRRAMLVGLDMIRAGVALCLPFVSEIWQIYALIFVLQSASAAFTPTFQATIPDVLPNEGQYTRALSLSRLAYDMENILSPTIAALMLAVLSYNALFVGTALGFMVSALLVVSVSLPAAARAEKRGIYDRTTRGIRIYLATPRLRGLLALCMTVSATGAMVLVNSVVLVRGLLGLPASALAWTMFAFGAGSMIAALALPRILDDRPDRPIMIAGAALTVGALAGLSLASALLGLSWSMLLIAWLLLGLGYSAVLTPAGRLLRRSSAEPDRPALFAAQFALSHGCWLIAYPLAGWAMTRLGMQPTLWLLTLLGGASAVLALRLWPAQDPDVLEHRHDNLPPDHPHLAEHHPHAFRIDENHPIWPHPAPD